MNDGGHQAQNTAGALEFRQGGPVIIKPVKDLRMDGKGGLDAFFVLAVATLWWKLSTLGAVQVGKAACGHISLFEGIGSPPGF